METPFLDALVKKSGRTAKDPNEIWTPLPKQRLVMQSKAQIVGYAGEAGAGKTDLLIGSIVHDPPKTPAIVFREHFKDLDALRERCREVIEPHGGIVTKDYAIYPNGSRMMFAHITTFDDVMKWQGQGKERHNFDELAHVPEEGFRAVIGWNRSSRHLPCKIIAATNPPFPNPITGESRGEWMIDFFGPWVDEEWPDEDKAVSGEVRWYVYGMDEETGLRKDFRVRDATPVLRTDYGMPHNERRPNLIPISRTFIKAHLEDNPHNDNDEYRSKIDSMSYGMQVALGEGRWLRAAAFQDEFSVVPIGWVMSSNKRWENRKRWKDLVPERGILRVVSIDPSRGGGDPTVLMPKYEIPLDLRLDEDRAIFMDRGIAKHPDPRDTPVWHLGKPVRIPGKLVPDGDTPVIAMLELLEKIRPFYSVNQWEELMDELEVRVDSIGIGSSVVDSMHAMAGHIRCVALDARNKSRKRPRSRAYKDMKIGNARAEWFWNLREGVDPSLAEFTELPPDALLRGDLKGTRIKEGRGGLLLEEKKEVRKRLKRSTDTGDVASLCHADPVRLYMATSR